MLYMGNVLPGCETHQWNVFKCAVTVRMKTETLRVTVYRESFHAHYLVYKATVQKLCLRHRAISL